MYRTPIEIKNDLMKEAHKKYVDHVGPIPKVTRSDGSEVPATRNNEVDAFRHAYASGMMALEYGDTVSNVLGQAYEIKNKHDNNNLPPFEQATPKEMVQEKNMDLWNNRVGREIASQCNSKEEFAQKLAEALKQGKLITDSESDSRRYESSDGVIDPMRVLSDYSKSHPEIAPKGPYDIAGSIRAAYAIQKGTEGVFEKANVAMVNKALELAKNPKFLADIQNKVMAATMAANLFSAHQGQKNGIDDLPCCTESAGVLVNCKPCFNHPEL